MSRTRFRMRDTDRGAARLLRQLRGGIAQRLAVGITARSGARRQKGDDVSLIVVAFWHEFGTDRLPERSFIRAWADENRDKNMERIRRVARAVVQRTGYEERLLREVAREMVDEIKARIRAGGVTPPLTRERAAAKGDDAPLTGGQLEDAVTSEVRGVRGL